MATTLFDYGNITIGMYVFLIIMGILFNTIIFTDTFDDTPLGSIKKSLFNCTISCPDNGCEYLNSLRDGAYWLDVEKKNCITTNWEISHFLVHVFLGYFYNIYISQTLSIGYEIYEHKFHNCGSYLDLGYNFMGFLVGHTLKNYINSN